MTPLGYAAMGACPANLALLLGPPDAPKLTAAHVNTAGPDEESALLLAVFGMMVESDGARAEAPNEKRAQCVRLLLAAGADASVTDRTGNTLLMSAIEKGMGREMERELMHASASSNVGGLVACNKHGISAIHLAVLYEDMEALHMLLPHVSVGLCTSRIRDERGRPVDPHYVTCLHIACENGMHAMTAALLENGASVTAQDSVHSVPLHRAAARGHLSCVALLLQHMTPAESDTRNVEGNTALHLAAYNGHIKVCGVLITAGASPHLTKPSGQTALDLLRDRHSADGALLALLADEGSAKLPGMVCDCCGIKPSSALFCPDCGGAVYCGATCMEAVRMEHLAACESKRKESEFWVTFSTLAEPGSP